MTYIAEQDPNSPAYLSALARSEADIDLRELDPEDIRVPASESDSPLSTQTDHEELRWCLDWETYHR